jgi:thioredoxin reductase (NADPH)
LAQILVIFAILNFLNRNYEGDGMKKIDYDLVIIGGGPAGLTAGIYAARARMNTVLIEKAVPGGQILVTDWIENYPGFPQGICGADLVQNMTDQAEKFGLGIETNDVVSLDLAGPVKKIHLTDKTITASALIIATGASPRKLGIPGELKLFGKGVSTCATCDGPFYRDQLVVAVVGGDTAVQESLFLTKFARKVYLVHRRDQLRAAKILQERAFANDRLEIIWNSVLTEIRGTSSVEQVVLKDLRTGQEESMPADGCFIWIGIIPNTAFLDHGVELDGNGFILTDFNMQTSVAGVFAAGDVRSTPLRQVSTAVGDAAIAATVAEQYIESVKAQSVKDSGLTAKSRKSPLAGGVDNQRVTAAHA